VVPDRRSAPNPSLAAAALEALDDATRAIAEVLDLEAALQLIVDRVRVLVDAEYAALGISGPDGRIERFITAGLSREQRARIGPLPQGHGLLGLIIHEGQSVRTADIGGHPASSGFPPFHPPMTTFLGVPITHEGHPIGDLYMTDKQGGRAFDADDQRLVELFARHAAIAMQNARLHDRIASLAIVEERERIGRDLHDGIIQRLYAVSLSLEDIEELARDDPGEVGVRVDRAIDSLQTTISDIRHFILGLRPGLLALSGLAEGLERLAEEVRFASVVAVETNVDAAVAAGIDDERATDLIGLAREALSNVTRHSAASVAKVSLVDDDTFVLLMIEDDGVGFDPAATFGPDHQGLTNMRERAAMLGGTLAVERRTGGGMMIVARIPCSDAGAAA
jgi:signal transduction histidine kinase